MLRFTLNGTQIEIEDGENRTLLEYLRNVKCMKGTKEACSMVSFGAFSMVSTALPSSRRTSVTHERVSLPSTSTLHAPQ